MFNLDDERKEVVICPECGGQEYKGLLFWEGGKKYCRKCTYERWENQTNYSWNRAAGSDALVFPESPWEGNICQ